jgi:hypothetical protein
MFSIDEKLEYFLNVEKQIITIIKVNYKEPLIKVMGKIYDLIHIQNNNKNLSVTITNDSEVIDGTSGFFYLSLFDFSSLGGGHHMSQMRMKLDKYKLFETKISPKSIIREIRLDIILNKNKD